MARARNIKPAFFKNEQLAELPFSTRLLFIGLWTLADRDGRLEDRPKRIKMEIFPGDSVDVDKALQELHAQGFIARYQVEAGRFIHVLKFAKHQNPHHREPASTIPAFGSPRLEADATTAKPEARRASHDHAARGEPGASPADSLIPDSPSLIPDTGSLIPDPLQRHSAPAGRRAAEMARADLTRPTREAYRAAYVQIYSTEPKLAGRQNRHILKFVEVVGAQDAPQIAAFYVRHNARRYGERQHPTCYLETDAEGLATQWANGMRVTETEARQRDQTSARLEQVARLTTVAKS